MGSMTAPDELFPAKDIPGIGWGYQVPYDNMYATFGMRFTDTDGGKYWVPASMVKPYKRFSDAELAAEFYRTMADFLSAVELAALFDNDYEYATKVDEERERMFTLESFAMRPSYDIYYDSELEKD